MNTGLERQFSCAGTDQHRRMCTYQSLLPKIMHKTQGQLQKSTFAAAPATLFSLGSKIEDVAGLTPPILTSVAQSIRMCCVKDSVTKTSIPEGGQIRRIGRFSQQLIGYDCGPGCRPVFVKDGALAHQIM